MTLAISDAVRRAMSHPWLLEAALRSLVMGVAVFAALHLLRIRQVRAQRTAWVLALFAALAMPAMVYWPLHARMLPVLGPREHASLVSTFRRLGTTTMADPAASVSRKPAAAIPRTVANSVASARAMMTTHMAAILRSLTILYLTVTFLLLLRLLVGVALTLRLRSHARPARFGSHPKADVRVSGRIATPVTIGSTILMPASCTDWGASRLCIVLAHEQAHVDNADFYILLLAKVHCALYWFSPFGWLLQHQLAALGEALSDRAALDQAESRSTYAQVLLDFAKEAMQMRRPFAALAVARSSNLRPRIERLLNNQLFEDAFSTTRRYAILAATVVPVPLSSATLVGVHVARTAPSQERHRVASSALTEPYAGPASFAPGRVDAPTSISPNATVQAPGSGSSPGSSASGSGSSPGSGGSGSGSSPGSSGSGFPFDGRQDSWALVTADGNFRNTDNCCSGGYPTVPSDIKGEFLYVRRGKHAYILQDPALLSKADSLYAPVMLLATQRLALGKQQEALRKQQEVLGTIQQRNGARQGDAGQHQRNINEETIAPREQQSTLPEEQERLAQRQDQMGEASHQQLKPLIDQAIREGRTRLID